MSVKWERLIRFVATDGRTLYGEPVMPSPDFDLGDTTEDTKLQARVLKGGDDIFTADVSDETVTVKTLLGPLAQTDVPILRCVGLNYAKHIREVGRSPPPFPSIFFKPPPAVHDHGADVEIPPICQNDQADYEGEFCLVIGPGDCKNATRENAMSYVAAYTCGNDVSSRKHQKDPAFAGKVPQWGFSKGFDTYAPLGPCLVRRDLVADEKQLTLTTTVDGEVRQKESVGDLQFDCAYLIEYLSSGTTLQKGTVIMTGTPGGVGGAMNPPRWLVPGTKMEVNISQIGTLKNGVKFV